MKKDKQEKEEKKGSTEPQNKPEEVVVNPNILEDDFRDEEGDEPKDSPEDTPEAKSSSVVPEGKPTDTPPPKETPTTPDFKRAVDTKFEAKAKGWNYSYRPLNVRERDTLFAIYEKWNGNLSEMILDKDCLFKGYTQINYYARLYYFKERLVEKRKENAERTMSRLTDAKTLAIENAIKLLESRHRLVFNRYGVQLFDTEGNPLIVEELPYYKSIKAAWEIIKTELGEATAIAKADVTSGGKPLQGNQIVFQSFKEDNKIADETDSK